MQLPIKEDRLSIGPVAVEILARQKRRGVGPCRAGPLMLSFVRYLRKNFALRS